MDDNMKKLTLTCLLLFVFGVALSQEKGDLTVNIEGIKSDEGQMIVDLHNIADAFPMEREKAHRQLISKITNGKSL